MVFLCFSFTGFTQERSSEYDFSLKKNKFHFLNQHHSFSGNINPLKQSVNGVGGQAFNYTIALHAIEHGTYVYPIHDSPDYSVNKNTLIEKHTNFSIEYINSAKGIKQNFILPKRLSVHNKVVVQLEFHSSNCLAKLVNQQVEIYHEQSPLEPIAVYHGLVVYDANGTLLPSKFVSGKNTIDLSVDVANAVFPLTIDPISSNYAVLNIGPIAGSYTGYSVSGAGDVNGDGISDVVVGAPRYQNGQTFEGAVFIYHGTTTGIGTSAATTIEGNIAMPATENSKYFLGVMGFGTSVSEAGDVNGDGYGDVIVGHPLLSNGNNGEGKIFVYYGSSTGVDGTADWSYETNVDSTLLGFSVSSAGDINGDGYADVVAGAIQVTNGQTKEGAAYVFYGSASGLNATPNVTLEANVANAAFGWSVSTAGDVNGDDYDDVIVTAAYLSNGQTEEGKAFVYHGSSTGLTTTAAWAVEPNLAGIYFGENASWAGDVNGDGYGDVIVGADYYTNGQTDEGMARIYHGSSTGLSTTAAITLESNKASALFGVGVNGAGDVNGDGFGDVIIGAYTYNTGHANEGAIYVYYGSSTGIMSTNSTLYEANKSSTNLGISVAGCGDVNGDGFSDVIAGAYLYDGTSLSNAGAFYIFHGEPEKPGTVTLPATPYNLSEADANLGDFVTTIGDVNRDGYSDVAVGASFADNGGTNRGIVYIFHGSATGYPSTPNTTLSGPAFNNARFGCSIGAAGDVNGDGFSDIVVGASGYSNGQATEGLFRVYLGSSSGINTTHHLTVESNLASAQLGYSVAGAGDVNGDGYSDIIVGARTFNGGTANEGKVFVYHGSSTGVDATADWSYETNVAEQLGACVAGVGDVNGDGYSDVIALSSHYSNGQTNEGRILYFRGSSTGLEAAPGTLLETNIANSALDRNSTSFIGDMNGDGFNDVVVGVSVYNSGGTSNEGILLIYYGASPSLYFGTTATIEGNVANYYLGATIGFGGDVNGDGYNDLVTGAPLYNGGVAAEGVARVYIGGPSGLSSTLYYSYESNVTNYGLGSSVSAAGDCNGDGFSDLAFGCSLSDAGLSNGGAVYFVMGNYAIGVLGKSFLSRQFKSDLSTVVQTSNGTFEVGCTFGVGQSYKHHLGKGRGKQAYEFKGHPHPFNNYASALNSSVTFSGQQATFSDLGLTGTTMTYGISATGFGFPKWRTRTRFHLLDALDGQIFGRWFYGGIHDKQDRSLKVNISCGVLQVELLDFSAECDKDKILAQWNVANEQDIAQFQLYTSSDGIQYDKLKIIEPNGKLMYRYYLELDPEVKYLRLATVDNNGYEQHWDQALKNCQPEFTISVYPNPSSTKITVKLPEEIVESDVQRTIVTDLSGKIVHVNASDPLQMQLAIIPPGSYFLTVVLKSGHKISTRFTHL